MTLKEQKEFLSTFISKMEYVIIKKGMDYANDDKLSNFKFAGNICGLNSKLNCLSLIATKVARLGVLLNSDDKAKNESIEDSILDLANYAVLLGMIIAEEKDML